MVLDPQVSPEQMKSKEVLLSLKAGLLLPQVFLNSGATDTVFLTVPHETAIAPFRLQIRPLSFILLSHSDNQSETTTKFYKSSKTEVGGTC